jgi:hypothetical protein
MRWEFTGRDMIETKQSGKSISMCHKPAGYIWIWFVGLGGTQKFRAEDDDGGFGCITEGF